MSENTDRETYSDILEAEINKLIERGDLTEDDVENVSSQVIQNILPQCAEEILEYLRDDAPRMLKEHRSLRRGFITRNRKRWKRGFDQLEMLIVISQETGEEINRTLRPAAAEENNAKFEALITLHARAILVSREILCLMFGGFADGALGRWRTLHEIATIASFLSQQDPNVSERYLLHRLTQSYRAAKQYVKYERVANLKPFGERELEELQRLKDQVVREHGESMLHDWGWASPVFGRERPTFADIEKYCNLDHWRPRYKWASQDTHASYRPPSKYLGMSEADKEMLLVGESNSGMTDPAHMTAISLVLATSSLVAVAPILDWLISVQILKTISDEIGDTFYQVEKRSLRRHLKKQN